MGDFLDAFISYGRADSKALAAKLHQRLTEQGYKVWIDQNDIPLGVDFQDQIDDGIAKANNFLFIIAPHSVNSSYCGKEIELAVQLNKRIIPILHVEQITQEIWQQRHPNALAAEWDEFTAKGLHSSLINLHPAIAKINWIFCRDQVDDFDTAFAGLINVIQRHQDYVQQHTYWLTKALEWERQHRQTRYLLLGAERQQAEAWLMTRFHEEKPPCIPTDLHCEYIAESRKNANNLMTEVFLSHAEEDDITTTLISKSLIRQGFTVWWSKTDIQTGVDFQEAIARGIEEADNIIYLISPASLQSKYCQWEIDYALSLNKRIIPLLIKKTEPEQIPAALRSLQYIDLTDNVLDTDYQQDESKLFRILRHDADYFGQHKLLLAKALKWQRQQRNSSLLLRGNNLRYAEAWLKLAHNNSQHPSTPLQEDFIAESLRQPDEAALDVFISYSRADADFVRKLNDALQNQGKRTWFDQESIASGTDFQKEIFAGIEISNHFLFVISPNSINSPYCVDEVEYAKKLNKRIVTVLYRPVNTADLHPALAAVQWIDFYKRQDDFYLNLGELIRTLDSDQEHKRSHTRLILRAIEWEREGYDSSYLLYGKDLIASERWLAQSSGKMPAPSPLQLKYIQTSRKSPFPQAKVSTVAISTVITTFLLIMMRSLGILQPWELKAFDHLVKLRPSEPVDSRILIVEVTEDDIINRVQRREKGLGTLSDEGLTRLLDKLEQYQPRVIGLDFYRDFTVDPEVPALVQQLQNSDRLVSICKLPNISEDGSVEQRGVAPPPEVAPETVAFNDVLLDDDEVVRRLLIRTIPPGDAPCQAGWSFGFQVAQQYLALEPGGGIPTQDPVTSADGSLRVGDVEFQRLMSFSNGYQGIDASGFQILANYRAPDGDPENIAERVTIGQILNDEVPESVTRTWKDRIILIGVTSENNVRDILTTPYRTIPGVMVQAQITSQVISAVLDNRLLLRVMSTGAEALWIMVWCIVGGSIVYVFRSPLRLWLAAFGAIALLYLICLLSLILAGLWLPLIPAALAGIFSASGIFVVTARLSNQTSS
ncbi:MAG: TIR domain-containing protein [Oculatellaceae cyanobacterium bins.114]|nr:TIR domain-containing protein [Oculatellaceae cyanobacterium bins.114]